MWVRAVSIIVYYMAPMTYKGTLLVMLAYVSEREHKY